MTALFETWYGVFDKKGELSFVEPTRDHADVTARQMVGPKGKPWPVRKVVVVESLPMVLLSGAVDYFEKLAKEERLESAVVKEQIAYAVANKETLPSNVGHGVENLRRRMEAARKLVDSFAGAIDGQ